MKIHYTDADLLSAFMSVNFDIIRLENKVKRLENKVQFLMEEYDVSPEEFNAWVQAGKEQSDS